VLITNDDGIGSRATVELARAFAQYSETFLVVPIEDQSSSTNFAAASRDRRFEVEKRDVGEGFTTWAVNGYPADCVLFALAGPLRETRPDLVISGVNTGSNVADAWISSGTIGAVRMAAYYGVPAIAVSGVDNEDPQAIEAVVRWVVKLARSKVARQIRPPQYLTVSLPVGSASQIQGIEITQRARGLRDFRAQPMPAAEASPGREVWSFEIIREAFPPPKGSDADVVAQGRIAIVSMRANESDPAMGEWLVRNKQLIPLWQEAATSK